jgi:hypothetical protein
MPDVPGRCLTGLAVLLLPVLYLLLISIATVVDRAVSDQDNDESS